MHIYTILDTTALIALLAVALITALIYGRWHYWWRSAFGLSFMAILLAFAGRTPAAIMLLDRPLTRGTTAGALKAISLGATLLALCALSYLLWTTIALNVRRQRQPPGEQAREHLSHTPGISAQERQDLLDWWDEHHSATPKHPSSRSS